MEIDKNYRCMVLADSKLSIPLSLKQNGEIEFFKTENLNEAVSIVQNRYIDCIILLIKQPSDSVNNIYNKLSSQFPFIPILVILDNPLVEVACSLGQQGAKYVVAGKKPDRIKVLLNLILNKQQFLVGGIDFLKLNRRHLSTLLHDALHLIVNHFLTYVKVQEIAKELHVTEAKLCREFKRQFGVSCKKMILFLRIYHSTELMRNESLQIKQIAYSQGFKRPERFTNAFFRITGMTPKEYRKHIENINQKKFWQEKWQTLKKRK